MPLFHGADEGKALPGPFVEHSISSVVSLAINIQSDGTAAPWQVSFGYIR